MCATTVRRRSRTFSRQLLTLILTRRPRTTTSATLFGRTARSRSMSTPSASAGTGSLRPRFARALLRAEEQTRFLHGQTAFARRRPHHLVQDLRMSRAAFLRLQGVRDRDRAWDVIPWTHRTLRRLLLSSPGLFPLLRDGMPPLPSDPAHRHFRRDQVPIPRDLLPDWFRQYY